MVFDYVSLGRQIRREREVRGWTQADLSAEAGMSASHISSTERGNTEFSVEYLVKLANAFDIPIDKLLYDEVASVEVSNQRINDILKACQPWEIKLMADCIPITSGLPH